jgi:hypothetical protein
MRNEKAHLSPVLLTVASLLAATSALATDPVPVKTCNTNNGWTVTTADGPLFDSLSGTTSVTYSVGPSSGPTSTPDHVGTFVRWEAGVPTASGSSVVAAPCAGDSVIGVGTDTVCHERIVRFNNQQTKASNFTVSVSGNKQPITTSVVVRKGNSQGSCRIVGIGLENVAVSGSCVQSCGNFNPNQTIRKVETFKFKGCEIQFTFNLSTGEVTNYALIADTSPGHSCAINGATGGPASDLSVMGGPISGLDTPVTFGDGWLSSGSNSCSTRLISGRYYTVCQ